MGQGLQITVVNKPKKKKKINWRKLLFVWGMLAIPLIHFAIFFIYVNIDSVVMTFRMVDLDKGEYIWTLHNYERFFRDLSDGTIVFTSLMMSYWFLFPYSYHISSIRRLKVDNSLELSSSYHLLSRLLFILWRINLCSIKIRGQ